MKVNLFKLFNLNEIEKEYHNYFLDNRIKQFFLAVAFTVISAALLAINDFLLCRSSDTLLGTLFSRVFFIVLSMISIILVKKNRSIGLFNLVSLAWLTFACSLSLYIAVSRPAGYVFGAIWDILVIFAVYLMVPAVISIQISVGTCYLLALAFIWYVGKQPVLGTAAANSLVLALTMANLIGAIFSWQLKRSACKQFLLYKEDQKVKAKLRRQNEAKNKFFSIISHDLRSPVGNIISICDMAKNNAEIPRDKLIGLVSDGAQMAYSLLENLLAWAKSESGQLDPSPSEFNVDEFISEKLLFFKHSASSKHISMFCDDTIETLAYADYNMIDTVLRNLLSNAIKFTPNGGQVRVSAAGKDDMIEISVRDNGVGIDDAVLPQLFDIDFHHSTIGTNDETGTGLGLKLCKEFVVKNGGDMWVESKKNIGSIFTFSIPRAKTL